MTQLSDKNKFAEIAKNDIKKMAQLSDKNFVGQLGLDPVVLQKFVGQLGLDPVVLQMTQLSDKKKITEMAKKWY